MGCLAKSGDPSEKYFKYFCTHKSHEHHSKRESTLHLTIIVKDGKAIFSLHN